MQFKYLTLKRIVNFFDNLGGGGGGKESALINPNPLVNIKFLPGGDKVVVN